MGRAAAAPHLVVTLVGRGALAARDADAQAPRLPHDGERQLEAEQTYGVQGRPRERGCQWTQQEAGRAQAPPPLTTSPRAGSGHRGAGQGG